MLAHEFIDSIHSELIKLYKGDDILLPVTNVYDRKVPINGKKIQDVAKILQYIPDEHKEFYRNIKSWTNIHEQIVN